MVGSPQKKNYRSPGSTVNNVQRSIKDEKSSHAVEWNKKKSNKMVRIRDEDFDDVSLPGKGSIPLRSTKTQRSRKVDQACTSDPGTNEEQAVDDVKNINTADVRRTPARTNRNKRVKTGYTTLQPSTDPVIEQWYADPYNRHDPEGPAGVALRKQNLKNALRNRGFRGARIDNIINWLVRCNGRYKEYDELVGGNHRREGEVVRTRYSSAKRRIGRPRKQRSGTKPLDDRATPAMSIQDTLIDNGAKDTESDATITDDTPTYPSPISVRDCTKHVLQEMNDTSTTAETESHPRRSSLIVASLEADCDSDDSADDASSIDEEEAAALEALDQGLQSAARTREFHTTFLPGTQAYKDAYDDWLLSRFQRTMAFWDMIYGDDLDVPGAEENAKQAKFTYFRDPHGVPTIDVQYRTQNLKSTKKTTHKGKEVLTEDVNFGLCAPSRRLG